jgi:hypothetical protein
MRRTSEWVLTLCLTFFVTALIAFTHGYFVDATILALYGTSGIFFIMSPQRTKDYRWNSFKLISYLMFICGIAVSVFKYIFLETGQI